MRFEHPRERFVAASSIVLASIAIAGCSGCLETVADTGESVNNGVIDESRPLLENPELVIGE